MEAEVVIRSKHIPPARSRGGEPRQLGHAGRYPAEDGTAVKLQICRMYYPFLSDYKNPWEVL